MADTDKTELLSNAIFETAREPNKECPVLFVCQGKMISEYRLNGRQILGRPADGVRPDIPIFNRFISRRHGMFETENGSCHFTALKSTNPTLYKGGPLESGERVLLSDGDELEISYETGSGESSIMLILASSSSRVSLWRDLQQTCRDELTMLYGRTGFSDWWTQNREGDDYRQAAIFLLDVDDFKKVNDIHGHNAGDLVLKSVAEELRKTVRYDNQICRWGGDEFLGVLPGTRERIEERLLDMSRRIAVVSVVMGLPITTSVGYVHFTRGDSLSGLSLESLVEMADKALYRTKENGKNGINGYN